MLALSSDVGMLMLALGTAVCQCSFAMPFARLSPYFYVFFSDRGGWAEQVLSFPVTVSIEETVNLKTYGQKFKSCWNPPGSAVVGAHSATLCALCGATLPAALPQQCWFFPHRGDLLPGNIWMRCTLCLTSVTVECCPFTFAKQSGRVCHFPLEPLVLFGSVLQ